MKIAILILLLVSIIVFIAVGKNSEVSQESENKDPVNGMECVFVKGGCFNMGSENGADDEKPVHKVCVNGFI